MLEALEKIGWNIEICNGSALERDFHEKYPSLPQDFLKFICSFRVCTNKVENQWFISVYDYLEDNESYKGFKWDEFEKISIESAKDNECIKEIKAFWSNYLPFFICADGHYSYYAICLNGEHAGKIAHGFEPEFEEVVYVADTFNEFKSNILDMIKSV